MDFWDVSWHNYRGLVTCQIRCLVGNVTTVKDIESIFRGSTLQLSPKLDNTSTPLTSLVSMIIVRSQHVCMAGETTPGLL